MQPSKASVLFWEFQEFQVFAAKSATISRISSQRRKLRLFFRRTKVQEYLIWRAAGGVLPEQSLCQAKLRENVGLGLTLKRLEACNRLDGRRF